MQSEELFGFYYNIGDMSLGAHNLYMLYDEVLKEEKIDKSEWKEAAQKCIMFAVHMTGKDGSLGRNYHIKGECDKYAPAISEALLAIDYMYADTGDESIHKTQLLIENWLYQSFVRTNNWANGCMDGGAWVGGGKPPKNNDAIGIMGFICYCAQMHIRTGEERYLQMAKDAFAYQWTTVIPIQIPGFTHATRGLVREQDFYSAYDLPMRINDYVDCLPYILSCTGMVRNLTWDPDSKTIHIWTYDTQNNSTTLELVWNSCSFSVSKAFVITSDQKYPAADLYDETSDILTIISSNSSAPSKIIEIVLG